MTRSSVTTAQLDALIEEATVDCYNEAEQVTGLFTMVEEHLVTPFTTVVLGVDVVVESVDLADNYQIVAACCRGNTRQAISIVELPMPTPPPDGAEWIAAYRRWLR